LQDLEFRHLVERVKLRAPIEGIVGQRVSDLRQKGALYWACCPFHEERTPSFAVDPRRGTWRCYGACGEGGDVLSFLQRFDALSFLDSLRLLAREMGEEIDEKLLRGGRGSRAEREKQSKRDRAYDLLRWAADFYREGLRSPEGQAARTYLERRGLSAEVSQAFGLGWAQERGNPLFEAARRLNQPISWLVQLGLLKEDDSGRIYDFFRGRLLIPIRDRLGRVVGFGGRLLAEKTGAEGRPVAKYVNTPETPLFHKGRIIYALDIAMEAVRKQKELHLVEGYTDVMAAHQGGYPITCAVLGTQTTEDHAALVRRSGVRRVVLVFDGDSAGRAATQKALRGLLPLGIEIRIAELPAGADPGDLLVSEQGRETYRGCIEGARDWFAATVEGLQELPSSGRSQATAELFPLLTLLEPIESATRLGELATALDIPEQDLRVQWRSYQNDQQSRLQRERLREPSSVLAPREGEASAEPSLEEGRAGERDPDRARRLEVLEQLLGALLLDNSLIPLYANLGDQIPEGELSLIYHTMLELYEADDSAAFDPLAEEDDELPVDSARVIDALGADPARERVMSLQITAEKADSPENLARDCARWLGRSRDEAEVSRMIRDLGQHVQSSGSQGAEDRLREIHRKLREGCVPEPAKTSDRSQADAAASATPLPEAGSSPDPTFPAAHEGAHELHADSPAMPGGVFDEAQAEYLTPPLPNPN